MLRVLTLSFALSTALSSIAPLAPAQTGGQNPIPATGISAADIQATAQKAKATKTTDIPVRTVDAGGHNVGLGVVHRPKGTKLPGAVLHDVVSEVYHILEGSGTLITGGKLVNPQRREKQHASVAQINGPGTAGTAIEGGERRRVAKGDVIIIPAATPHWFPEIQEDITYTVVRVDPTRVVALK
jgi:mannose-6-phosphate isomerase-like protein (cupin superfamily)